MKERLKLISRQGAFKTTGPGLKYCPDPDAIVSGYVYNKVNKLWYKKA